MTEDAFGDVTTSLQGQVDDLLMPAGDVVTDDFEGAGPVYGIVAGRYRFPAPPGEQDNPRGWMRMTNLVSAFSDQERLQLWLEAHALIGLRANDGVLFDEWMAEPIEGKSFDQVRELANQYAERAREASHGNAAARKGTARHLMMSTYFETGERTGTRVMRAQLDDVLQLLDEHELDVLDTEFKVWHPAAGGTMGTADARVLCRRTGQVGILDWKTQMRFWTFQEIAGQLYGYDSARWCWAGPEGPLGRWVHVATQNPGEYTFRGREGGPYAGQRVALVAHMPRDGAKPELYEVDLAYGRAVLECAARNVELRSIGKSTMLGRRPGWIRPRA